jgi:predicted dehydrogenase
VHVTVRALRALNVAVIGFADWGANLTRNFAAGPRTTVVAIADVDPQRRTLAAGLYPRARIVDHAAAAIADPEVDAVVIATPIATHRELAALALRAGKHVLVEKPLATSVAEAEELVELAAARRRALVVDHTLVYTDAARHIRELVAAGELGRILNFDSVRINLGRFKPDVNVLWDLAPHDLAVMDFVLAQPARWVSAAGASHYGKPENLAYVTIGFDDGLLGHVHASWVAPVKTRRTIIAGSKKMLVWDDLAPAEPVRIYDSSIDVQHVGTELDVQHRSGAVCSPQLEGREALATMAEAFAAACLDGAPTPSDGAIGVRIVKMLAAAQRSLEQLGARIAL